MIGGFGNADVFSFHATRVFGTAEGGAIATDDDDLARKCRLMRNFGFVWHDQVDYIGTNGKMSELAAALGLTNLESLDDFIETNERHYRLYATALAGLPGIHLIAHAPPDRRNYHNVVIGVDSAHDQVSCPDLFIGRFSSGPESFGHLQER
jgi:dTDP-4-amino-4,6-dideoxygalactose transaminase